MEMVIGILFVMIILYQISNSAEKQLEDKDYEIESLRIDLEDMQFELDELTEFSVEYKKEYDEFIAKKLGE